MSLKNRPTHGKNLRTEGNSIIQYANDTAFAWMYQVYEDQNYYGMTVRKRNDYTIGTPMNWILS